MTLIKGLLARRKDLLPESGFAVIGIDKQEVPGPDAAYLASEHETREEAEKALVKHQREGPEDSFHIYPYPGA